MGRCFQHQAKTNWDQVTDKFKAANCTVNTFLKAQQDYLEMVAKCKNIGDCLIRQLWDRAKPAVMKIDEYINRRNEWKRHLKGPFLRKTFSMPTNQEWAEQIFMHQPKEQRNWYACEHDVVETDVEKLKQFFRGCHTQDVNNGTYAKVMKNARDAQKARLAKAAQLVAHPCELNNSNVEHGKVTVYEGGQVYTV